jgi:phytoene dehydrogenase-like protein
VLDAVVIGSGPNGLSAALTLTRAGLSVEVVEGSATFGGGCRTAELTLPGFHHDVCATIQSMATLSPFFRTFSDVGGAVVLRAPDVALAHPLEGGRVAVLKGSVETTAGALNIDAETYRNIVGPLVDHAEALTATVFAPLRSVPRHPLMMAQFARSGLPSAVRLANRFRSSEAKALFAGLCAHASLPLEAPMTAAFGLLLAVSAHDGGWPVVEGGSGRLTDALVAALQVDGATMHVNREVRDLDDVPRARAVLFDTSAAAMVDIAGRRLTTAYKSSVARFERGPGVFKVDWALSGAVPWTAEPCRRAGTVHVGGTFDEIARSEREVASGQHSTHPYCIVVQACVADPTRAPDGQHTLWAYCHVPNGSNVDMTDAMERQIERFAPGFRDLILESVGTSTFEAERHNPNYLGGDISGGASTLRQTIFRPTVRWNNYRTGTPGLYLCSSSTPPGGGVHGMCGYNAAHTVLSDLHRGSLRR